MAVTRDDLIDLVRYGKITPDEAEAEAARLGLGGLSCQPPDSSCDPMAETSWTLVMAVAWIAWRTPDRVRTYWEAYRRECWSWRFREWRIGLDGPIHAGHFLEQWRPATLSLLQFAGHYDLVHGLLPPNAIGVSDAIAKLWQALSQNTFEATGIRSDTGERVVIPSHAWHDLTYIQENERDVLRARVHGSLSQQGYEDVSFKRENLVAVWQPHRLETPGGKLPTVISPEGPGFMPLYSAAQWIATHGGAVDFIPQDESVWRPAFEELLARIASNQVTVTGVRDGTREKLDGHIFAGIPVDYPFSSASINMILGEDLYLSSCVYIDEDHWRKGWNDSLQTRQGCKWSKLMVLKSEVEQWWSFKSALGQPGTSTRTGAPGRPSSMHLIEAEHTARWKRGEADEGVGAEARALRAWFVDAHPLLPPPTADTIENKIRDHHRERKAKARK